MCVRAKAARVGTVRYNTAPPPGETPTRRQREEVRESTQPRRQEAVWWAQKKEGYPTPHQGETTYAEIPEASPHHSLYSTTRRKRRTTDQRQGRRTCQWAPQETQKRHGTQEQRVAREVPKKICGSPLGHCIADLHQRDMGTKWGNGGTATRADLPGNPPDRWDRSPLNY